MTLPAVMTAGQPAAGHPQAEARPPRIPFYFPARELVFELRIVKETGGTDGDRRKPKT